MNRFRKHGFQLMYGTRFTKREDDIFVSPPAYWTWEKYRFDPSPLFWFNDKETPNQYPVEFVRLTFRICKS